MNENSVENSVSSESPVAGDSEPGALHPSDGLDAPSSGSDTWVSGVSGGDAQVYYYTPDLTGLIDDDLGGVPVVVMSQADNAVAIGTGNGFQLSSYYVTYFQGVLDNIGDTDYLAFATREYPYGNNYWVEHYRLIYDIEVVDGEALQGVYPCLDIYRYSSESTYYVDNTTYQLSEVPSFSYGSFGTFSDLRKGGTLETTYTSLFFLGFFAVYLVCNGIYRFITDKIYRK